MSPEASGYRECRSLLQVCESEGAIRSALLDENEQRNKVLALTECDRVGEHIREQCPCVAAWLLASDGEEEALQYQCCYMRMLV